MKISRPGAPPGSGGAEPLEPLDPRELQANRGVGFDRALEQLEAQTGESGGAQSAARTALGKIAAESDLSTKEGALAAVRASARYMVGSRLAERYRESPEGEQAIDDVSEYVAADPNLRSKLLSILNRIKQQQQ